MLRPIRPFSASANLRAFLLCPLFFRFAPLLIVSVSRFILCRPAFFSAFPLFFPRVPFPAAHFPFASALAPPLCGLPFACRSQCLAVPLCDSLRRNFAPALSLGGFSFALSQRFPLAVSYALRPSAFPRRFLSRSAPALPLGGFSRASTQRFSSRERLHAHAPAWKFFSKIPLGIFELRRFFPRLRRFVLCCQRQPASPKRSAATADRRFCGMKGVHTYDPYRSDDRLCIPGRCRAFC